MGLHTPQVSHTSQGPVALRRESQDAHGTAGLPGLQEGVVARLAYRDGDLPGNLWEWAPAQRTASDSTGLVLSDHHAVIGNVQRSHD